MQWKVSLTWNDAEQNEKEDGRVEDEHSVVRTCIEKWMFVDGKKMKSLGALVGGPLLSTLGIFLLSFLDQDTCEVRFQDVASAEGFAKEAQRIVEVFAKYEDPAEKLQQQQQLELAASNALLDEPA